MRRMMRPESSTFAGIIDRQLSTSSRGVAFVEMRKLAMRAIT